MTRHDVDMPRFGALGSLSFVLRPVAIAASSLSDGAMMLKASMFSCAFHASTSSFDPLSERNLATNLAIAGWLNDFIFSAFSLGVDPKNKFYCIVGRWSVCCLCKKRHLVGVVVVESCVGHLHASCHTCVTYLVVVVESCVGHLHASCHTCVTYLVVVDLLGVGCLQLSCRVAPLLLLVFGQLLPQAS